VRTDELFWSEAKGWSRRERVPAPSRGAGEIDLVLYFGIREALENGARYFELRDMFPKAHIVGCSTGGQIHNNDVSDDEIAAAALSFDATNIRLACEAAKSPERSRACGDAIGRSLAAPDLAGIFVLSDGLNINGSELVAGITGVVGEGVPVTGGLAGDGAQFKETLVGADCAPRSTNDVRPQ